MRNIPKQWIYENENDIKQIKLTEQSAWEDCTQPESSFLIQHAVSLSFACILSISFLILLSILMQGANFAPKWIRSAARGPNLKQYFNSIDYEFLALKHIIKDTNVCNHNIKMNLFGEDMLGFDRYNYFTLFTQKMWK